MKIFLLLSKCILVLVCSLISVAFLTLLERKVLSLVGLRIGPNKVSFLGIFQPLGDALKLANKGKNILSMSSFWGYFLSCCGMLVSSLYILFFLPLNPSPYFCVNSYLWFFLILSFNSFLSVLAGWSTFSKYSLIGSIRTVSQLISYEAALYVCVLCLVLYSMSFEILSVGSVGSNGMLNLLIPCFFCWLPIVLAELNRTPFDFSEGESELVSGFNTEFGSAGFTLIFLAEYGNMVFFSLLTSFLFLNSFFLLSVFFLFFLMWIRSVLPRFRFDKLMMICWKFYIPFLTFFYLFLGPNLMTL